MQSNNILFAKLVPTVIAFDIILQAAKVQMENKLSWEPGGGGVEFRETAINKC